ncbi:hypothetical protein [Massilia glaciei]|uniref:Competence protein n=1 Tax=Massilia glaciei TaxID=1524097 RepID=A0A2U2HPJ9_9BURK|nr:hypothetical protein [Massilia glaciei]PWF49399.1 hypothetical protein C7C56_006780 [Massilia glaciei]
MKTCQQAAMTFAVSSDGRVVHVDDVSNGTQCGCICTNCRTVLIAKNGGHERAHHFAHHGSTDITGCAETALHLAAKQIVSDYKRLALPAVLGAPEGEETRITAFNQVSLEYTLHNPVTQHWIVADCFATCSTDPLIIEIAVRHRVDEFKAAKIRDLKLPAIEIDLSDQIGKLWTWDDLENAVLFDLNRRQWIYSPQSSAVALKTEVAPMSEVHEWKFAIGATWVWVKELPFGNVRVFHRFDDQARRIVEPICRNRGYWNSQYKNWIVFDHFKLELLQQLSSQATRL